MTSGQHKSETVLAKLALQLCNFNSVPKGNPPSDEELAAFYDNKLSTLENARIKKFLAHHPDTYRRWIGLIETAADFEQDHDNKQPLNDDDSGESPRLFLRPRWMMRVGGALAASIALMSWILNFGTSQMAINQSMDLMYEQYAHTLKPRLPTKQISSQQWRVDLDPSQRALASGVLAGLNRLGELFNVDGLTQDFFSSQGIEATALQGEQYKDAFLSGQLAVLIHFQCQSGKIDSGFKQDAYQLLHDRPQMLKSVGITGQQDAAAWKEDLCVFSQQAFNQLRLER